VSLSTDRCFPGQELAVSLGIHLKPGWHIYGKPLPDNYQATELLFDGLIVGEQALELPPSKPMLLKSLGETLPVYSGEIRAVRQAWYQVESTSSGEIFRTVRQADRTRSLQNRGHASLPGL
jgi:hypothetical protein